MGNRLDHIPKYRPGSASCSFYRLHIIVLAVRRSILRRQLMTTDSLFKVFKLKYIDLGTVDWSMAAGIPH